MKNDQISSSLKEIFLCLIADEYELESMFAEFNYLTKEDQINVRAELRRVINRRLWSQRFYLGLTGFEFETKEGFYTYLEEIWQYVFNDGPLPQVEKYWY